MVYDILAVVPLIRELNSVSFVYVLRVLNRFLTLKIC